MRLYFAHPINAYHTPIQRACLDAIARAFPNAEIVNPDTPEHDAAYAARKTNGRPGMTYFVEDVIPACDLCVFLAFGDLKIPSGVALELETFAVLGRLIYEVADIGAWTQHGRMFCFRDPDPIETLRLRFLERGETVARVRDPDGNPRPYCS